MEPLTGWPNDVLRELIDLVSSDVAENPIVTEFYIGRSVNPAGRASDHGSDDIISIYFSDSIDNAIEVEETLIEEFHDHPKCSNHSPHGGGGTAEDYGSYVYVAVWL